MNQEELFKVFSKAYAFIQAHSIHDVRNLAREFGVKSPTSSKKDAIAAELISIAAGLIDPRERSTKGAKSKSAKVPESMMLEFKALVREGIMLLSYEGVEKVGAQVLQFNDSGEANLIEAQEEQNTEVDMHFGILDFVQGNCFLREMDFMRRETDLLVPPHFITKYGLKKGDILECGIQRQMHSTNIINLHAINGRPPLLASRSDFDDKYTHLTMMPFHFEKTDIPYLRALHRMLPFSKGSQIAISKENIESDRLFFKLLQHLQPLALHTVLILFQEKNFEQEYSIQNSLPFITVISRKNLTIKAMLDALYLILEQRKRAVEFGADVLLIVDDIAAMLQLFEQAEKANCSIEMCVENLTAKEAVKAYLSTAKMHYDIGSLTICAFFEETAENAQLLQELMPNCNVHVYLQKVDKEYMIDFQKSYIRNRPPYSTTKVDNKEIDTLKEKSATELLQIFKKG